MCYHYSLCGSLRKLSTTLHPDRNLAVSPLCRHNIYLKEVLVPLGLSVTARIPHRFDGRVLPATLLRTSTGVSGLSSYDILISDYPLRWYYYTVFYCAAQQTFIADYSGTPSPLVSSTVSPVDTPYFFAYPPGTSSIY